MNKLLFVYGTLKEGECNHDVLGDSLKIADYTINTAYKLVDLGPYPALYHSTGLQPTKGELYCVSDEVMVNVDTLEGFPHLYERTRVATPYGLAHVYYMEQDLSHLATIIEWPKHQSQKEAS